MPRLSFSVRDVFWLTMVVGLALGWWVESRQWAVDRQALLMEARYSAALNKPLSIEFIETPLVDVAKILSDLYAVQITLDEPRLKRVGLTRLSTVNFKTENGDSLGDGIKKMLSDKATIIATEEALLITAQN